MNRAVIRRWSDILILSLLGAIVACLLLDWQRFPPRFVGQFIGELSHVWVQYAAILLLCVTAVSVYLHLSPFRLRQIRFVHRYPPTWVAALLAAVFARCLESNGFLGETGNGYDSWVWSWAGIAILVGCFLLILLHRVTPNLRDAVKYFFSHSSPKTSHCRDRTATDSDASPVENVESTPDDSNDLEQWIATDSPITHASEDQFDRRPMVCRFADRLLSPLEQQVTIGLLGDYGSGKTSVVNLVQREVDSHRSAGAPSVVFCKVDCWGFHDSGIALQSILASVVKKLGERVDCLALTQLPESYRNLLAGGGGWLASFSKFMDDSDPKAQLRRLTPILRALNTRLVLIIEELDRPQSKRFDPQDIEATLHRLKEVAGVSFILTGSKDTEYKLAFTKLCDHIEDLGMHADVFVRVIRTARQRWLTEYGDIDPTPKEARQEMEKLLQRDDDVERYVRLLLSVEDDSFASAIAHIVKTPRTLTRVLRHTGQLWNHLHGEICFDDLLVAMILRFGAEEAHDFLLRRVDILQNLKHEPTSQASTKAADRRKEAIEAEWKEVTKQAVRWDIPAAESLIVFLFPHAASCFGDHRGFGHRAAPQGVQHGKPTNYWRRLLAGGLSPDEMRDQVVLKQMRDWSKSQSGTSLAEQLCQSKRFVEVWEHFAESMQLQDLLRLGSQVLDLVRQGHGAKASMHTHSGAVSAIGRRVHQSNDRDNLTRAWLLDQITRSVPTSLRLANDLYHYWGSTRYGVVKTPKNRNVVRKKLVEQTKQTFSPEKPDDLIKVLDPEYPYSIQQLVCPSDHKEPPSLLNEPSDWKWLGPVLLNAATRAPNEVIPQIVFLVTHSHYHTALDVRTAWREEFLEDVFGANVACLMQILRKQIQMVPIPSNPAAETIVIQTRELAAKWLK